MTRHCRLAAELDEVLDTVEPAMPTCATMTQQRPTRTLCPIWTWLSSCEPAPITVSPVEPRSIAVLAPTSTSSSMITRPS